MFSSVLWARLSYASHCFPSCAPPLKPVVLSPSFTGFFLFSCQVLDCCGLWNDGVVFELYLCVLGSACASCEGYLTAVFGFISALSLHRCPRVIVCHHQGGDLLLLKMLLGSCSPAPSTPPSLSLHTHTHCVCWLMPFWIFSFSSCCVSKYLISSVFFLFFCFFLHQAFSQMCKFPCASNTFSSQGNSLFVPATAICLQPSFVFACVYTVASLCC